MIAVIAWLSGVRSAAVAFWASLPQWVKYALLGLLAAFIAYRWHEHEMHRVAAQAAAAQKAADQRAYAGAAKAAFDQQHALVVATAAKQAAIDKETTNALQSRNADIASRYDALDRLWAAHRAAEGRSGQGGATALPGAAAGTDEAPCRADGWLDLETAEAAARSADETAAQLNALIDWVQAQAAAYPVPANPGGNTGEQP